MRDYLVLKPNIDYPTGREALSIPFCTLSVKSFPKRDEAVHSKSVPMTRATNNADAMGLTRAFSAAQLLQTRSVSFPN